MKALLGAFALAAIAGAAAAATGWSVSGLPAAPPFLLTEQGPIGEGTAYVFECKQDRVLITEVGVTQVRDMTTGKLVGDDPGSVMPAGAAMMALYGGKGDPNFAPAVARANATRGWDLTIEVDKNSPPFVGLAKAKGISLMTTGMTGLVEIGPEDRKIIADFVGRCRAG